MATLLPVESIKGRDFIRKENFMSAALIFIIWTWGLTPTWVNVVCTIILGLDILCSGYDYKENHNL